MTRPSPFGSSRVPVAVLGATGAVGQAFVRLLARHPWFELREVAASERSAGKPYREAARWIGDDAIPDGIAALPVLGCDPSQVKSPVVFSALDSSASSTRSGRIAAGRARS
jgi:aspartate-semialdehyde dehydrogenase